MGHVDPSPAKFRPPSAFAGICIHGVLGGVGGLIASVPLAAINAVIFGQDRGPVAILFMTIVGFMLSSLHSFGAGAIPGLCAAAFGGRYRWSLALLLGSPYSALFCTQVLNLPLPLLFYMLSAIPMAIVLDFGDRFRWKHAFLENLDVQAVDQGHTRNGLRILLVVLFILIAIYTFIKSKVFFSFHIYLR